MKKIQIVHIRTCHNCRCKFSTFDRHENYCDNCSYMETTQEWRDRANASLDELVIR